MTHVSRQQLRQAYRQRRQALSSSEQLTARARIAQQLTQLDSVAQATKIACYLSNDGEVDLTLLIENCWYRGIAVYLPVLHPFRKGNLLFIQYRQNYSLNVNKYGIAEPVLDVSYVCPVADLDVVLTPLVAFDAQGNRLGMGGGYYDRTLSKVASTPTAPALIGISHDCQHAPALPSQGWDIPMHQIVTPTQVIAPK